MIHAVDLFAGLGGFTLGAEQAGVRVRWASNHWKLVVDAHERNHPHVAHVCQDLRQADWTTLPRYQVLLASPACQGHSQASQPKRRAYHDDMRATAWAVVDCADMTSPRALVVENVLWLRQWRLYPDWCSALRRLGYHLTELELTATDFGVPQLRTRLFIVGMKRRPFHFCPPPRKYPAFGPHIDWSAPGWRPISVAQPGAQGRIRAAQERQQARRLLVQHVTGHPGVPLDEPVRTITTKDQWIVVEGDHYRPFTIGEYARAMGFPDTYQLPDASREDVIRALGNAVPPPMAREVVSQVAGALTL